MTNIAAVIFSDPTAQTAEPMTPDSGESGPPFDELLADVSASASATPKQTPAQPGVVLPSVLLPFGSTLSFDGDAPSEEGDLLLPVISSGDGEQGDEEKPPVAAEDEGTVFSSYLAMWQILPPPTPSPLSAVPLEVGEENISSDVVTPDAPEAELRTDDGGARGAAVAGFVPVASQPTDMPVAATPTDVPAAIASLAAGPRSEVPADVASAVDLSAAPTQQLATPTPAPTPAPALTQAPDGNVLQHTIASPLVAEAPELLGPPATAMAPQDDAVPVVANTDASPVPNEPATVLPPTVNPARAARGEGAGKGPEIKGSRPVAAFSETVRGVADGIPVAKEQRVMRDPEIQSSTKTAPAVFAEPENSVTITREPGVANAAPVHTGAESGGRDQGSQDKPSDQRDPAAAIVPIARAGVETDVDVKVVGNDAKTAPSEVAHVIQQIERTVERMKTTGGERLEMRVPLQDGGEVVVKLRLEHGEVKAIFHSAPEGLRQALETGWSQFGQSQSERATRASSTVLEAPSMQSGTGGFQQSSDQRERSGAERHPASEFAFQPAQPESRKPNVPRRAVSAATSSTSLQIYA